MAKLNTQTSIVDYLKSQGKDSSYSARKELATSMGIKNYKGTAEQNTTMLKALQKETPKKTNLPGNGKTATKTNLPGNGKTATKTNYSNTPTVKGVDEATTEKITSTYTPSSTQTAAQNKANSALSNLESVTSQKEIVSGDIWDVLGSQFTVPQAVTEADAYLKSQLEKIQSGKTSYSDQVKEMMSQIQNRDKFSYDVDTDPLFQQALASAMNSGKQAMQDTIGQASALTGGYGSTYATSAGNQAYNAFIEDAYNNLPQYYQMAMEAYQMEGDEMYRQLGMLTDADATYQHRNQMYNEAYTQFRDSKTDALNTANLQLSVHGQLVNDAYNLYSATSDYANTLYNREYTQWADEVNQAMQWAGMLNTDYWNQTNFDEGVRQYEKNFAEDVRQFDTTFAENQRQFDKTYEQNDRQHNAEMGYKYAALNEDKRQFNETMAYNKSKPSGGSGSGKVVRNGVEYKEATSTQKQKALEAYNKGGETEYYKYLDSLESDVDIEGIDAYVFGYTDDKGNSVKGYGELPLEQRTYTKIEDTFNWGWGNDNNDKVKDQYEHVYRIDQLPESLRKELTKLKKDESKDFSKK